MCKGGLENFKIFGTHEAFCAQVLLESSILRWAMASVAVGAGELQPAAAATVRQEMQNWVSFPNFLLPDHWVCLQSNERQLHKLETVVNHLIRMGLRHPSERTQATLAAIVSHVGPNAMDPFAAPDVPKADGFC